MTTTPDNGSSAPSWEPNGWQALHLAEARPWVLVEDDPRMGLMAGDVLLCIPYDYDRDKLTVVARESDGFDPTCNVYRSQVQPMTANRSPGQVPDA